MYGQLSKFQTRAAIIVMPQAWQYGIDKEEVVWVNMRRYLQSKRYSTEESKMMRTIFPSCRATDQGSYPHSMQRLLSRSKAKGTLRGYTRAIKTWLNFAADNNLATNPSSALGVTRYITLHTLCFKVILMEYFIILMALLTIDGYYNFSIYIGTLLTLDMFC